MNKATILGLSLLVSTGCASTNKSFMSAPVSVAASSNLYANMEVGEKISGQAKATYFLGFLQLSGPNTFADGVKFHTGFGSGSLKAAASFEAMKSSGAEVIVNPQYVVHVKKNLIVKTVTVDVTGYKGLIKNFSDTGPQK
jgi:hypothetical protein